MKILACYMFVTKTGSMVFGHCIFRTPSKALTESVVESIVDIVSASYPVEGSDVAPVKKISLTSLTVLAEDET